MALWIEIAVMVWYGLVWISMVWYGFVFGMIWFDLTIMDYHELS